MKPTAFDLSLLISRIYQKNAHVFVIEWADGRSYDYTLAELQRHCPCARCCGAPIGQSRVNPTSAVDPDVRALRIYNLGRYALRVEFTKGCSRGVYTFTMLRDLGKLSCT
jgi:ATP-binding protein involved in chromosome partitioning